MKKFEDIFETAVFVARILLKASDSEEDKQFEDWYRTSEQNRKLYEHVQSSEFLKLKNKQRQQINIDQAWENFNHKIQKNKIRQLRIRIMKYAAVLLVPVLVISTVLYLFNRPLSQIELASYENEFFPESQDVVLLLNNGEKIGLSDSLSLEITEKDGTIISTNSGRLKYEESSSAPAAEELTNVLVVDRGGEYDLILSDGTEIFVNSMSKLTFPVTFPDDKREVSIEGEACFIVSKDSRRPFIVNIGGTKVEVLGTTFNVNAYADNDKIVTTLVEGKIQLTLSEDAQEKMIVKPNEQVIYNVKNKLVETKTVNAQNFIDWKNGIYTFSNQTLGDIMKTLSRWYNLSYRFNSEELSQILFEGRLNKYEEITPILEILESTGKVIVETQNNEIIFKNPE